MAMLAAILIGGKSRRMGRTKALLPAPDAAESILARTVREVRRAELTPILVGAHDPYRSEVPDVLRITDIAGSTGPLAGILAALRYARGADVVVLSCDLPFVDAAVIRSLAAPTGERRAMAIVDELGEVQPLLARYPAAAYRAGRFFVSRGGRSAQKFLLSLDPVIISAANSAVSTDWDTPADVASAKRGRS